MPDDMEIESEMAAFELDAFQKDRRPGTPSGFACPDCAGVLWELQDGEMIRFRCRVGHAWTANSLLAEQSEGIETALWTALRALEERAALSNRIAERMHKRGSGRTALRFEEQAHEARRRAAVLRQVLITEPNSDVEPGPDGAEADEPDALQAEGPQPNG